MGRLPKFPASIELAKRFFMADQQLSPAERIVSQAENTKIKTVEHLGQKACKYGLIHHIGFTTTNGHPYTALVGLPSNQTSDLPVIGTSAWLTSVWGHNQRTVIDFLNQGSPVFFVGAENSYHNGNGTSRNITLARSAAATLRFCQQVPFDGSIIPETSTQIDAYDRYLIGESRGAMVGMGVVGLEDMFEQNIVYADLTAPCFPRKLAVGDFRKLARASVNETKAGADMLGRIPLKIIRHYPATLDMHPDSVLAQIMTAPALFSGEAGDLARLIGPHKSMHITTFDNDVFTMRDVWELIFVNYDQVRITPIGGAHLTIADPETRAYILARHQGAVELHSLGADLDSSTVSQLGHEYFEDNLARLKNTKTSTLPG